MLLVFFANLCAFASLRWAILNFLELFQEYVQCAGAAIGGAGRAKGQHLITLLQPGIDLVFQDRQPLFRTKALTVHDAYTAITLPEAVMQEFGDGLACLKHGIAVQVEFGTAAELAAAQLAHEPGLQAGAAEQEFLTGFDLFGTKFIGKHVIQHLPIIRCALTGHGPDFWPWGLIVVFLLQRAYALEPVAKQLPVGIGNLGFLRHNSRCSGRSVAQGATTVQVIQIYMMIII